MNQRRRPEGNGSGGEGRIRGSGSSDKRGRGHQLPGSLCESSQARALPSNNTLLKFVLGLLTQHFRKL